MTPRKNGPFNEKALRVLAEQERDAREELEEKEEAEKQRIEQLATRLQGYHDYLSVRYGFLFVALFCLEACLRVLPDHNPLIPLLIPLQTLSKRYARLC